MLVTNREDVTLSVGKQLTNFTSDSYFNGTAAMCTGWSFAGSTILSSCRL